MRVSITSVLLVAGLIAPLGSPCRAGVVAPHGTVNGKSLAAYTVDWWRYVLSVPGADNPEFDATGAKAHIGQGGPVFFLVGSFAPTDAGTATTAERDVKVTDNQYLFFPILNSISDNLGVDPPLTYEQLHDATEANVDTVKTLFASVDGVAVPNLFSHREESPQFSYSIPDHNIYERFGADFPAQTVSPVAADGYWLMVEPLSVGEHDVRFGGTLGDPATFTLNITYHLQVVPLPDALWTSFIALPLVVVGWRRMRAAARAG